MEKKHYGAVDGLRMIAAFGIVMMHIRANNNYEISGFIYNTMIPSFTNFVFLFMTVSAFGMCCGYYEKIINNKLSLSDFYGKRFKKIFPFFCILLENKRRVWGAFTISLIYNFACRNYFQVSRTNILYCACFFLAGGLIYLYRDEIAKLNQWIALGIVGASTVLYYIIGGNVYMCLLVSCALLIYAIIKGGYWRTELQSSSAVSVWRSISLTW